MSGSPAPDEDLVVPIEADVTPVEEVPKKRKADVLDDAVTKKRNQRMFGALMGTLAKAKKEGSKQTPAAKRRTDIEERLQTKLKAETIEVERKTNRVRQEKNLKLDVLKKQEERSLLESIHKQRQSSTLHLSRFLCTTTTKTSSTSESQPFSKPYDFQLPLHTTPASATPAIYYLPFKLQPEQADQLVEQSKAATAWIEEDKEYLTSQLSKLDKELDELKEKRDKGLEDLERQDRAERAEREKRERDESPLQDGDVAMTAAADPSQDVASKADAAPRTEEGVEF